MPGTYHIIPFRARYTTRRVPSYAIGPGHRRKTHMEESVRAKCGRTLVKGRDQFCNISIATPDWNYDWCHDCVRAYPWNEDGRKAWLRRGIETMDSSSWEEWLKTPEGEYAKQGEFD